METVSQGGRYETHGAKGRGGPTGSSQGGGVSRGAGHRLLVGRGDLQKIKQLMEKLVNVTEQTNLSINEQNPLPSPYVTEFQQKQAAYIELLSKPNKTALDQFHIKRLGQRIQEITQKIQTE